MNPAPSTFVNFCKDYQLSEEQAQNHWVDIWKETTTIFLNWLLSNANLTHEELKKLETRLNQYVSDDNDVRNILGVVIPILDDEKATIAYDMFASIFVEKLTVFYQRDKKHHG